MNYIKVTIAILFSLMQIVHADSVEQETVAFAQDDLSNDFRKAQMLDVEKNLKKYPEIKFVYSDAKAQTSLMI